MFCNKNMICFVKNTTSHFKTIALLRETFKKKKSVDFFHTGGGVKPKSTLLKKIDILFFFFKFCPILSIFFCGLEGHFQGEIEEEIFSPKMCFHTLWGGGGGSRRCGKNPPFLFFFFEGFPYDFQFRQFRLRLDKYTVYFI